MCLVASSDLAVNERRPSEKIIAESRERESRRAATPIRQVPPLQTGSGALYGIIVPKVARSGTHRLDVMALVTDAVKLIFHPHPAGI